MGAESRMEKQSSEHKFLHDSETFKEARKGFQPCALLLLMSAWDPISIKDARALSEIR